MFTNMCKMNDYVLACSWFVEWHRLKREIMPSHPNARLVSYPRRKTKANASCSRIKYFEVKRLVFNEVSKVAVVGGCLRLFTVIIF